MSSYNTPYDDAYKTMIEKFPQLLILLINEIFEGSLCKKNGCPPDSHFYILQ